jgi:hypothetical protein
MAQAEHKLGTSKQDVVALAGKSSTLHYLSASV